MLDRDGTVNVDVAYLSRPEDLVLIPNAAAGLRQMQSLGLGLVIVTNQSGIARGFFDESTLQVIHDRLRQILREEGVELDGVYYCPHHPQDGCGCRKPGTLLAVQASRELGFDLQQSFVVGDKATDIGLGARVGATTFLVETGAGRLYPPESEFQPDYVVADLQAAAEIIKRHCETTQAG